MSEENDREVDPGFVYEIIALKISNNTIADSLPVGWLFSDHTGGGECWAMIGPWESKTAETWKRKPGRDRSTVIRFNPIASKDDAGYPTGADFETRKSNFFKAYENYTARQYVHTVTIE